MFLLISSYIADLMFGDPQWFPHPVKGMGKLITFLEKHLRGEGSKRIERIKGVILSISVMGVCACCAYLFIELSRRTNPFLGSVAWIFLAYTSLATKDLFLHAKAVWKKIKAGDIAEAQHSLSRIAGRDTDNLSKEQIITATIESIAENTNDGIIAPLFYLILGGPVLAITYKAINTLDSMVGCKNEKYLDFGWFSAKLDDIANFIPARISGFLISISSLISGKGFKSSFKTMLRDGRKHPSPNSGISEAAMAGALGIRLGGAWSYQGKPSVKPYLGEGKKFLQPSFINSALTISLITSILMVSIGVILKWLI
jgi:adenosylcobinamide-phosphate synthase